MRVSTLLKRVDLPLTKTTTTVYLHRNDCQVDPGARRPFPGPRPRCGRPDVFRDQRHEPVVAQRHAQASSDTELQPTPAGTSSRQHFTIQFTLLVGPPRNRRNFCRPNHYLANRFDLTLC